MSKQTSKKICFIASHFPQGGAERQITELIKGLIERGYQITLICYQSNVIFFREIKELNIELILNNNKPSKSTFIKWIKNVMKLQY